MSTIHSVQTDNAGRVFVTIKKSGSGGWHRLPMEPCEDLLAGLAVLNSSLASVGANPISETEWAEQVVPICASAWVPSVVEKYRTIAAPEVSVYTQLEYANAVEARFDREAQALGYDNLAKATTYVASGNVRFSTEAKYFVELRDACWLLCFEALENPPEIVPTPSDFAEQVVTQALAQVSNKKITNMT